MQIRWQPIKEGTKPQVLITATSYDDFPIARLIDEAALGNLPPALQDLLEQLKQELPARELRYQQAQSNPKNHPTNTTTKSTRTKPDKPAKPASESDSTQITLF
jgi:hypothetical protein